MMRNFNQIIVMTRAPLLFAAFVAIGCVPPKPAQLAPRSVQSSRSPIEAVQIVARTLAADGFEIVTSDATGGVVSAKRLRAKLGNADFISCRFAAGSLANNNMETTLFVTFTAQKSDAGAAGTITSRVNVAFPGFQGSALAMPPSDDDCTSNGTEESKIAAAVK